MEWIKIILLLIVGGFILDHFLHAGWNQKHKLSNRKNWYRNVYLKSDAWRRKRYVVLKRDDWKCQYCGSRATQVHHERYLWNNLGKEPIKWLVSICKLAITS